MNPETPSTPPVAPQGQGATPPPPTPVPPVEPTLPADMSASDSEPASSPSAPGVVSGGEPSRFGGAFGGLASKKLLLIGSAAAVLTVGVAGYVFGYYIPNKPANVYATALSRTGDGYDKLVDYVTDKKVQEKYQSATVDGNFKFSSKEFSSDGTFGMKGDDKNATFHADAGVLTTRVKVEGVAKDVENSESPDLYLKVSGIKGMGTGYGVPGLDSLDGQWITLDHSLVDTYAKAYAQEESSDKVKLPTNEDLAEVYGVFGKVADKYLFTKDEKKSVLEMRQFVGKEVVDGKDTLHYKVGVNKANYKAFINELGTELDKTKLNDWIKKNYGGKNISESMKVEDADIKEDETADMWVNADTKLIHKFRFADSKDSKSFVDLGLNYGGGDEYPFFLDFQDGKGTSFRMTVSLNTKTDALKVDGVLKGSGDSDYDGNFTMTVKPGTGAVDAKAPTGAITLQEALDKIGLGAYMDLLQQAAAGAQAGTGLQRLSETGSSGSDAMTAAEIEQLQSLYNLQ